MLVHKCVSGGWPSPHLGVWGIPAGDNCGEGVGGWEVGHTPSKGGIRQESKLQSAVLLQGLEPHLIYNEHHPVLLLVVFAVVTSISDSGDFVTVSTGNGTKLTAGYVIVTVPLGVLKQDSIDFEPPLPADKLTAIKEMVGCSAVTVLVAAAAYAMCVTLLGRVCQHQQRICTLGCSCRSCTTAVQPE